MPPPHHGDHRNVHTFRCVGFGWVQFKWYIQYLSIDRCAVSNGRWTKVGPEPCPGQDASLLVKNEWEPSQLWWLRLTSGRLEFMSSELPNDKQSWAHVAGHIFKWDRLTILFEWSQWSIYNLYKFPHHAYCFSFEGLIVFKTSRAILRIQYRLSPKNIGIKMSPYQI